MMYLTANGPYFWIISDTGMGDMYEQSIEDAFTQYYSTYSNVGNVKYNIDLATNTVTSTNHTYTDIDSIIAILPDNTTYSEFTRLHPELLI